MIIFRFFFIFILIIFLFFGVILILAQQPPSEQQPPPEEEPECPEPPSCPGGSNSRTYYRCTQDCNGEIQEQTTSCSYSCWPEQTGVDEQGCPTYQCVCDSCTPPPPSPDNWKSLETGNSWQKCFGPLAPDYSTEKPYFACDGSCLEAPENPQIYDGDQENPVESFDNIRLPIYKFDWDDVEGWAEEGGVQSYLIEIENTTQNSFSKVVDQSEFVNPPQCLLKSSTTHPWSVRACCNPDGTNCGPKMEESFTTSLAPELISPQDPDFEGPEYAQPYWNPDEDFPVNLDWCDVPQAKSYYIKAYKDGKEYQVGVPPFWPLVITKESKAPIDKLGSDMDFGLDFFTKETLFDWQVATCLNENGTQCGKECGPEHNWDAPCTEFSQKWSFKGVTELKKPKLLAPREGAVVNQSDALEWLHVPGARSYWYYIEKEYVTVVSHTTSTTKVIRIPLKKIWFAVWELDTEYSWKVQPCWDDEGQHCEEGAWSDEWKFITTGSPPTNLQATPLDPEGKVLIPTKLDWEDVPGAASYNYEIIGILSPTNTKYSDAWVDYPTLIPKETYQWRVQTCADETGEICGEWSSSHSFTTFSLSPPTDPSPSDGGEIYPPAKLSWNEVLGARYYQYKVDYTSRAPEETRENCLNSIGKEVINKIVSFNSDISFLDCLGDYQWQVRSCLDEKCQVFGDWSSSWKFTLSSLPLPAWGGLVPCGRYTDDPHTPWDERETCQIKHLFLMIRIILDFLLWKIGPIILVLLAVATGLLYYFSFGLPALIWKARSMLKMAGIGYLILLFSWTIINLVLKILGVPLRWWIISF